MYLIILFCHTNLFGKNILNAAYSVVSRNKDRAEKKLWTENSKGSKIKLIECYDDKYEANQILEHIYKTKFLKFDIIYILNA